jgi:hypothetical protein
VHCTLGLPVAFLATTGRVKATGPLLTDKNGVATMAVKVSRNGARIVAIVDEYTKELTAQIKKK